MSLTISSTAKLSSGRQIPRFGFGSPPAQDTYEAVLDALRLGIRHVDTAQMYTNEPQVAQALAHFIKTTETPRSEIYLTTKWNPPQPLSEPGVDSDTVYNELRRSYDLFVTEYGLEYIDLALVHQSRPGPEGRANHWRAMVRAQKEGWVKDIGVSNHNEKHLAALPAPVPSVNQFEIHPWMQQEAVTSYCFEHGIQPVAFCPLVRAKKERVEDPVVVRIGGKHGKTWAQVILRWSLQRGFIPIPQSRSAERIQANADIFDFELDEDDMKALNGLEIGDEAAASVAALKEIRGP